MRQAVAGRHGQQDPSQVESVEKLIGRVHPLAVAQEGEVEVSAVGDHAAVSHEFDELAHHLFHLGRELDVAV